MEFFTAYYDETQDKIVNAKPNTLVYYHEEGHREQNKKGKLNQYQTLYGLFITGTIAILVRGNFAASIVFIIALLCIGYLEIDAWIFAIKKYRKIKRENKMIHDFVHAIQK